MTRCTCQQASDAALTCTNPPIFTGHIGMLGLQYASPDIEFRASPGYPTSFNFFRCGSADAPEDGIPYGHA